MKVFISWSGSRSLAIARALYTWLPRVIQSVNPWMSDSDIDKGTRWEQEISFQLSQAKLGILCLTPENLDSRWINFEAGAIAKTVEKTYLCTYLFGLKPTDIEGPLSQFNHTRAEKEDTRKLIRTIYRASGEQSLREDVINDTFDQFWPRLEESLNHLPPVNETGGPARETRDMVEEILELVRAQRRENIPYQLRDAAKRMMTTLDWEPEDASYILTHYDQMEKELAKFEALPVTSQHRKFLEEHVRKLRTDENYAREVFDRLHNLERISLQNYKVPPEKTSTTEKEPADENSNS